MRTLLIACLLALGLVAFERRASADVRTEKAREHYGQADAYYKLDKYSDALHEYEQAYIAKPDPSFLYNIAQCHRLMGDKPEAVKYYRRYLRDAPAAPNRAIAEKHIRELEAALNPGAEALPHDNGHPLALPPPPLPPMAPSIPAQSPPPTVSHAPVTTKLALDAPPPTDSAPQGTQGAQGAQGTQGTIERRDGAALQPEPSQPFYTKWWFWTAVGAVAVGTLVLVLSASHDPSCPSDRTACK